MNTSLMVRRAWWFLFAMGVASCAPEEDATNPEDEWGADQIIGANSVGRRMAVEGFVYVPTTASQSAITSAVASQMRVLFGARHTDLGPFRAIRVDALRHLAMRDEDYGWTVEMQLKARVARLTVREVAVRYRERIGTSKITGTLAGSARAGFKILAWILGWRLALLRPGRGIPTFRRSGST